MVWLPIRPGRHWSGSARFRRAATGHAAEVYTPAGLAWIESNSMALVLLRHYPQLRPALRHVDNAFKPWRTTSA